MQRSVFIVFALVCLYVAGYGNDVAIEPNIKVFKSRGSLQCTGGGIAPEVMKDELTAAGIDVKSFSCGFDGLAHPAVCGTPDGSINIFEIPPDKPVPAQTLGFQNLSALPHAQETPC